jgi:hypothetical protein
VSPTERSSDLRGKGAPPLNGLRSDAALAIPCKSVRSVQSVLPSRASTERMPETCFSPQQLLCLHTERPSFPAEETAVCHHNNREIASSTCSF